MAYRSTLWEYNDTHSHLSDSLGPVSSSGNYIGAIYKVSIVGLSGSTCGVVIWGLIPQVEDPRSRYTSHASQEALPKALSFGNTHVSVRLNWCCR